MEQTFDTERHRKTPEGVNIEKRIATGQTAFFTHEHVAAHQASLIRSYYYPCVEFDEELGCDVTVGFCVPK